MGPRPSHSRPMPRAGPDFKVLSLNQKKRKKNFHISGYKIVINITLINKNVIFPIFFK